MAKVKHNGYDGYIYSYKEVSFIVWNGSPNTKGDWYASIEHSNGLNFSDRELDFHYPLKSTTKAIMENVIDNAIYRKQKHENIA